MNVLEGFRDFLGLKYYPDHSPATIPDTQLAKLFSCMWCLTPWIAGALYGVWLLSPIPVIIIAASGLSVWIDLAHSFFLHKE